MAWYNETQPDWTEEGTQGMAMVDALKLMTALKGSQIEQLEKQANTMRLLGLVGGEGKGPSAAEQMEQRVIMDVLNGVAGAPERLNRLYQAKSGQYKGAGSGEGGKMNMQDYAKELEAMKIIAPTPSMLWSPLKWYGYTPEKMAEKARNTLMGANIMSLRQRAAETGLPPRPGSDVTAEMTYMPSDYENQFVAGTDPLVAQLLQQLIGTMGNRNGY